LAFAPFGPLLLLACSASVEFSLIILPGCCYSAAGNTHDISRLGTYCFRVVESLTPPRS
jgi:hypothetical protein